MIRWFFILVYRSSFRLHQATVSTGRSGAFQRWGVVAPMHPPQLTGLPRGLNTNSPSLQLDTTTTPLSKNG